MAKAVRRYACRHAPGPWAFISFSQRTQLETSGMCLGAPSVTSKRFA
jgi:hypothetical protein